MAAPVQDLHAASERIGESARLRPARAARLRSEARALVASAAPALGRADTALRRLDGYGFPGLRGLPLLHGIERSMHLPRNLSLPALHSVVMSSAARSECCLWVLVAVNMAIRERLLGST